MLGRKATDTVTGLKGVITAMAEFWHSPPRYELTPEGMHEGEPMKPIWLDEPRLKVGKALLTSTPVESTVQFGEEVRDSLTDFRGVVVGRFTFINGCVRIEVVANKLKDGVPVEAQVFDEQRLTKKSKASKGGPRPGPDSQKYGGHPLGPGALALDVVGYGHSSV